MNYSKLILVLFFITSWQLLCAQVPSDTLVERKADSIITAHHGQPIGPAFASSIRPVIYQLQNQAFVSEENGRDYKGSLRKINKALQIWKMLGDTVSEANLSKYKGFLLGHLHEFPAAKKEILRAIDLYKIKNIDYGVAVSKFDMARVYDLNGKADSALLYTKEALDFWKTKNDTSRLVIVNNELLHLFLKLRLPKQAKQTQKTIAAMINFSKLNWRPLIDYYYLSNLFAKQEGESRRAKDFLKMYHTKQTELSNQGVSARSAYELSL